MTHMTTARAEATKVRLSKEVARRRSVKQLQQQRSSSSYSDPAAVAAAAAQAASDERETKPSSRPLPPPPRQGRRDRIAPESPRKVLSSSTSTPTSSMVPPESTERPKRRKSKSAKFLKVDVDADVDGEWNSSSTPRTAASTPSPASSGVRGQSDWRSPGQRKTPSSRSASQGGVAADPSGAALPDFITQTDRYGNAATPRSQSAIETARQIHPNGPKPHLHVGTDGKLTEEDDDGGDGRKDGSSVDACTETLLDSLRLMCCCLMPDDGPSSGVKSQETEDEDALPPHEISAAAAKAAASHSDRPRLLPKLHPDDRGKKCLVLDLDETLVHSSFRAVPGADFVIPVQIEDVVHFVYVAKRPGVDEFLAEMAKHYEIVVYTASLNKYADPLLDLLDPNRLIRTRLFRESCVYYEGNYVKDLSLLDRDLEHAIIVDNSPSSYIFHPENAIDCSSFIDDPSDRELDQIAAFLTGIKDVSDVRGICPMWRDWPNVDIRKQ